jgi:hypothetical protein
LPERGGLRDRAQAFLTGRVENIDDFSACKITRKEDWPELYSKAYYFACGADDRLIATAFGRNDPFGSKLNAIFSSDIRNYVANTSSQRAGGALRLSPLRLLLGLAIS